MRKFMAIIRGRLIDVGGRSQAQAEGTARQLARLSDTALDSMMLEDFERDMRNLRAGNPAVPFEENIIVIG